LIPGIRSWIQW